MYEYIKGELIEVSPTFAVVDCGGIGYKINISVNTYSEISSQKDTLLYIYQVVRDDALLLYGFAKKEERSMFKLLISVSGIGSNTAIVMLSSLTVDEVSSAINTDNVGVIKSVKGIGLKTAQKVIIELKDKISVSSASSLIFASNSIKDEALMALVTLGYNKVLAGKVLDKLIASSRITTVEELIKMAFKHL